MSAHPAGVQPAAELIADAVGEHRLVLLGEMHGTVEIPALTGELVARFAGQRPVLLALEATSLDQPRVDAFLESDGGEAAKTELLAGQHWQDPIHDGRDSLAMFGIMERVRRLRVGGADVDVVMMDAPGDGERDALMAHLVRSAMEAHPRARVLVLTGNIHAMTGDPPSMVDAEGNPVVLPKTLGQHLADLDPVSVEIRATAGEVWLCVGGACRSAPANPGLDQVLAPELHRSDEGSPWDLLLVLPRFTLSPPAVGFQPEHRQ